MQSHAKAEAKPKILLLGMGPATTMIAQAVETLGFRTTTVDQLGAGLHLGRFIDDSIVAVLAALPEPLSRSRDAILVEIGVAAGLALPLGILVDPEQDVPTVFADAWVLSSALDNSDALTFHVDTFLNQLDKPRSSHASEPEELVLPDRTRVRASFNSKLEESIARWIDLDATVVARWGAAENPRRDWDGMLTLTGGGPPIGRFIVEVKGGMPSAVRSGVRQLQGALRAGDAEFGLLIHDGTVLKPPGPLPARVFILSVDELNDLPSGLGPWLRAKRNRAVHGE